MKFVLLGFVGLFLGVIVGGVLGVGAGLAWTSAFHTSSFEGYSGMLVFSSFMLAGMIFGGLAGALGLGYLAVRNE